MGRKLQNRTELIYITATKIGRVSKNDLENITNDKRYLTENEDSCTKKHYIMGITNICKLHLNLTQDMNKLYSSGDGVDGSLQPYLLSVDNEADIELNS